MRENREFSKREVGAWYTELVVGSTGRSGKVKSLVQNMFLRRNSADEMVTLAEQAIGSALQVEAGRNRLQKQLGTLQMGFGVSHVVGMLQEEGGDAEPSLHLHDREERYLALTYGFEAFHGLSYVPFPLVEIRQTPKSLRYCFHLFPPSLYCLSQLAVNPPRSISLVAQHKASVFLPKISKKFGCFSST